MEASQLGNPARRFAEIVRLLLFLVKFHLAFICYPGQPRFRFVRPRSRVLGLVIFPYRRDLPGWPAYPCWKIATCGACSDPRAYVLIQDGGVDRSPVKTLAARKRERKAHFKKAGNLITCLQRFKSQMEYKNADFDGDRPSRSRNRNLACQG